MHSRLKVVGMGCMGDEKWNSRLYFTVSISIFFRACWTHLARPGLARWNVECSIYYEKGRITFIIRSIIWWLTVTQGLHARTTCDDWKVIKLCEISSNLSYFCRVFSFFSSVGKSSQCIIFFALHPKKTFPWQPSARSWWWFVTLHTQQNLPILAKQSEFIIKLPTRSFRSLNSAVYAANDLMRFLMFFYVFCLCKISASHNGVLVTQPLCMHRS